MKPEESTVLHDYLENTLMTMLQIIIKISISDNTTLISDIDILAITPKIEHYIQPSPTNEWR
jgi:hypothetical protein